MLVLTILACTRSPVGPKWLSACSATAPEVTCVNADSVTYSKEDGKGENQIICHWNCAELGGEGDGPDSGPMSETFATGLDLVFQLDAEGVCYEVVHAHRYADRCP
jgi:hypothetical protein